VVNGMGKGTRSEPDDSSKHGQDPNGEPQLEARQRVDRAVLTLAEIIGRRMARDDFEARRTDNPDRITGQARDGPDEKDE
jgi:hypothetical protein